MHILDKIVAHKKVKVVSKKKQKPVTQLEKSKCFDRECNSYVDHLNSPDASGVIAEFKRKSPSKSNINMSANHIEVVRGYWGAGVGAISILTDEYFFGGANHYLTEVREALPTTPLLRKDFIIDEYQIIEAKSIGADIILLICEILSADEIRKLATLARSLGMEVLLELHSSDQIIKYNDQISMVGINNRDLTTFEVDYDRSKRLYDALPKEAPKIAESGLSDWETLVMLYQYGFHGFLIGEHFMKQEDPGYACKSFISNYMKNREQ